MVKTTKSLTTKLLRDLGALGETRAEVAKSLRALGIKGMRRNVVHCPIANYLRHKGYVPDIVSTNGVGVWVSLDGTTAVVIVVDTPKPIASFIGAFDTNRIAPYLVNNNADFAHIYSS